MMVGGVSKVGRGGDAVHGLWINYDEDWRPGDLEDCMHEVC